MAASNAAAALAVPIVLAARLLSVSFAALIAAEGKQPSSCGPLH